MKLLNGDHATHILVAFMATLGCFTAVAVVGADGMDVLHDVLVGLGGALAGIAVGKRVSDSSSK